MKKRVKIYRFTLFSLLLFFCSFELYAQEQADWTQDTMPFTTGVNFTSWLDDIWSGLPPNNRRWFNDYNEMDFANAKSIGVDIIRLPIAPHTNAMNKPDGVLDPVFLQRLDSAVTWAERYGLYLILDNHEYTGTGIDASIEPLLMNAWKQLATRYKDRSERIIYEVLNEPCYINAGVWAAIQGRVVDAIRQIDPDHYIIVAGTDWNSLWQMTNLQIYPYKRLIYNFHFYEPGLFTEDGFSDLVNVKNLPFPYDPSRMPKPPSGAPAWVFSSFASYPTDGTEASLANYLDPAVTFASQHNVPVMISEYGCNSGNNMQEDVVRWFETVVKLFNERHFPHASWGYKDGSWGITTGSANTFPGFPSNLNIDKCKAMGLNPPASVTNVTSVKVSSATGFVQRGKTLQFTATVTTQSGNHTENVIWTVNSVNGSSISYRGLLNVSPSESASTLTVTAQSVFDTDGSKTASATVTLTGDITGVEKVEKESFTIYPNPTDGAVTLKFETASTHMITLSDLAGRTLLRQTSNDQVEHFDLGNYSSGVYMLTVNDGKEQTSTRIIKN